MDVEALARLLGLGGERDWLDYKSQCDLSSTRDLVEITKDIGALMITGGYIVVGADDHGRPTGEPAHLELFDPASVHAKVARYILTCKYTYRVPGRQAVSPGSGAAPSRVGSSELPGYFSSFPDRVLNRC